MYPVNHQSVPAAASRQAHKPARNDVIVMAAGSAVFLASFLPWFGISLGIFSATQDAWHSLLGIAPVVLAAAVAGALAAETYAGFQVPSFRNHNPKRVRAAGSALALALLILRMIFMPGGSYYAGVVGPRYGVFLALAAAAVQAFFAAQALKASAGSASGGQKVPS